MDTTQKNIEEIVKKAYPKRYEYFANRIQQKDLHHAYILYGATGAGYHTVATWLASQCIDTSIVPFGNESIVHSDLVILQSSGKAISIEQIRSVQMHLSSKPSIAKWKVAVILTAEKMTEQAANALLKIVEEPPQHSIIILATSSIDQIVPPLISRCQKMYIPPIAHNTASTIIREYKQGATVEKMIHMADGGVDNIVKLLYNEKEYLDQESQIDFWSRFLHSSTSERRIMVNDRYLKAKNSKEQVHTINAVLDVLSRLLQEKLTEQHASAAHTIPNYTVKQVYARLRLVERIRSMSAQNVNKKSIFEYLITGI